MTGKGEQKGMFSVILMSLSIHITYFYMSKVSTEV